MTYPASNIYPGSNVYPGTAPNGSSSTVFADTMRPAYVWDGAEWVQRPVMVWDGSAWVSRPARVAA